MRNAISTLAAATLLFSASATLAAPTCEDARGGPMRCGAAGAMPVGWTASSEQMMERPSALPSTDLLIAGFYLTAAIFALLALMPEFDGRRGEDWDEQEGDRRRRS